MFTNPLSRALIIAALLTVMTGCGYTFHGSGSILPPDVKKVAIPMVENNSTESTLTTLITEALRDQFERYGALTVVEEVSEADAVLEARILKVRRGTNTVTARTDTALQMDTVVFLSAQLRRTSGPVLWKNPSLSVTRSFGTTRDVVVTSSADFAGGNLGSRQLGGLDTREVARGQEEEAFADLAEQVAEKVYDQAVAPDF